MFFTIIIPTLNEEKLLPRQLKTLSQQDSQDFEVIVVDAQSTDKTVAEAKKFQTSIANLKIISSPQKNISFQRNLGASKANGSYLIFSDADNQYPKGFFSELSTKLVKTPQDFFSCWFIPDEPDLFSYLFCLSWNLIITFKKYTSKPLSLGSFVGCDRNIFQKIGGFDVSVRYGEDKRIAEDALRSGYRLHLFISPKYILSLRRIRKFGVLKSIKNYITLNRSYYSNKTIDQEKDYPMGGEAHKQNEK